VEDKFLPFTICPRLGEHAAPLAQPLLPVATVREEDETLAGHRFWKGEILKQLSFGDDLVGGIG
jgi:hypothetical protein